MAITTLNQTDSGATSRTTINDNFTDLDTTKADLASPTFTGTPTLPTGTIGVTQSASDNSTKLATTAYVDTATPSLTDKVLVTTVELSAAEIISIYTTPKEFLPAPGVGKVLVVDEIIGSFTAGGTQFTGGGDGIVVKETTSNTTICESPLSVSHITGAVNKINLPKMAVYGGSVLLTENKSLYITVLTTPFATGNGTAKFFIKYRIITL